MISRSTGLVDWGPLQRIRWAPIGRQGEGDVAELRDTANWVTVKEWTTAFQKRCL